MKDEGGRGEPPRRQEKERMKGDGRGSHGDAENTERNLLGRGLATVGTKRKSGRKKENLLGWNGMPRCPPCAHAFVF
jgi:hypothetical protein